MNISKMLGMIALLFAGHMGYAQQVTGAKTIYIIRHAEKDTGSDPRLSAAGLQRAGDLYRLLADKGIGRIYQTKYRRSFMTGDSLRIYGRIDTAFYRPDTTGTGLQESMELHHDQSQAILVIGHSNTVPAIIRSFGVTNFPAKDLPDSEYNKIYILSRKDGKSTFEVVSYGRLSAGINNQMKP
jgi:phosphohistidine phosphatase SixA